MEKSKCGMCGIRYADDICEVCLREMTFNQLCDVKFEMEIGGGA